MEVPPIYILLIAIGSVYSSCPSCSRNASTRLDIAVDTEEISLSCSDKTVPDDIYDIPSFDAGFLTYLNNVSPLTLGVMVKKCFKTRSRHIKYSVTKLKSVRITKDILDENNSIGYLKLGSQTEKIDTDLDLNFLEHAAGVNVLIINGWNIPKVKSYFSPVTDLRRLDLSGNSIEAIEEGIFQKQTNLIYLSLRENKISVLGRKMFEGLRELTLLDLSLNYVTRLEKDHLLSMGSLKQLLFGGNMIREIEVGTFVATTQLEVLDLTGNSNLSLEEATFSSLTRLKTLNLSDSGLTTLPKKHLQNSQELRVLNVSRNNIDTLPSDSFEKLNQLRTIDLSNNKVESLLPNVLDPLTNLEVLLLKFNKLTEFDTGSVQTTKMLKLFDLSHNFIAKLTNSSKPFISEIFNVSHNIITDFPLFLVYSLGVSYLDLSFNDISSLTLAKELIPVKAKMVIDVSNNRLADINITNEKRTDRLKVMLDISYNDLFCNCLHYQLDNATKKQGKTRALIQLTGKENKCFANYPHYSCPLMYTTNCPKACNCYYLRMENALVVDCSARNLTTFPRLKHLTIDRYEYDQIFVNLSGNKLNTDGQENLARYRDVTRLDLSHNRIDNMNWVPPNVTELQLNNNQLSVLPKSIIGYLSSRNLTNVTFEDNPWSCDCDALDFQTHLKTSYFKTQQSKVLCKGTFEELIYAKLCDSVLKFALPIAFVLIVVPICILAVLYYKYETSIKVYLYSKGWCLWCVAEEEIDKDKTYDLFISFSHKDEDFVINVLLPELESGDPPFKVCIHYRDWLPGEYITSQIVSSVLDSRRTLVVLSNNFMESVWGKMEFRTAHMQAIKEGTARVIVMLYGDLDESVLDEEMRAYLNTNTYVKWEDPWFWSKLKYALPHSRTKKVRHRSHHSRESFHLA